MKTLWALFAFIFLVLLILEMLTGGDWRFPALMLFLSCMLDSLEKIEDKL